jgi:hypothetical protein
MSLLREIQDAAVSDEVPITTLLRKAKVLAARIGSGELSRWVDLELNGYPDRAELPNYRIANVRALGTFAGPFGSGAKNAPIPPSCIPEQFREWAETAFLVLPISGYEELLKKKDAGSFQAPWPPDLIAHVSGDIYHNMNMVTAYSEIPRAAVVAVVDGVRNRLLGFALELENIAPSAGESLEAVRDVSRERVSQVFYNHIYGNVGTFASGSNFTVNVDSQVTAGDLTQLKRQLEALGIDPVDVDELESAIEADGKPVSGYGQKVAGWLGKMIGKAASGIGKISVNTASAVLPKLLSSYYGLPSG